MTRQRVENTRFVDVKHVLELEYGELYKLSFERNQKHFLVKAAQGHCFIDTQKIQYATTRTGYGLRKWFLCPVCTFNTKKLYLPDNELVWACRKCHQLTYTKSQLSGNEFAYVTRKIRELQDELEVTEDNYIPCMPGIIDADIEWLPFFKPKYMRQTTFENKRMLLKRLILKRSELWMQQAKF